MSVKLCQMLKDVFLTFYDEFQTDQSLLTSRQFRHLSTVYNIQENQYFCEVYDYVRKADLSKGYWNPKRKLGITMHFSEIIQQQYNVFSKKCQNTKQCFPN